MRKFIIVLAVVAVLALIGILFLTNQSDNQSLDSDEEITNEGKQHKPKEGKKMLNKKNISKNFPGNNPDESYNLAFSLNPADNMNKKFVYEVKNSSDKPVIIDFNTSQRYEVVLVKKGEGEVYRFSKGRMFMQVLGQETLAPAEAKQFEISLPELQPGEYKLTVFLVGKGISESSKTTVNFTLGD